MKKDKKYTHGHRHTGIYAQSVFYHENLFTLYNKRLFVVTHVAF